MQLNVRMNDINWFWFHKMYDMFLIWLNKIIAIAIEIHWTCVSLCLSISHLPHPSNSRFQWEMCVQIITSYFRSYKKIGITQKWNESVWISKRGNHNGAPRSIGNGWELMSEKWRKFRSRMNIIFTQCTHTHTHSHIDSVWTSTYTVRKDMATSNTCCGTTTSTHIGMAAWTWLRFVGNPVDLFI